MHLYLVCFFFHIMKILQERLSVQWQNAHMNNFDAHSNLKSERKTTVHTLQSTLRFALDGDIMFLQMTLALLKTTPNRCPSLSAKEMKNVPL